MIFIQDLEKMTTEQVQSLGELWLKRLPVVGLARTLGKRYLYKPSQNKTRQFYANTGTGAEGVKQVFLEIVANVLIHEHYEACCRENRKVRTRKKAKVVVFPEMIKDHHITDIYNYDPYHLHVS